MNPAGNRNASTRPGCASTSGWKQDQESQRIERAVALASSRLHEPAGRKHGTLTSSEGLQERVLIGGRPVNRRHENVVQTQVHAHLRTVMDHVIQAEGAYHPDARTAENFLVSRKQSPLLHQSFIAGAGQGGPQFGDVLVKGLKKLLAGR